MRLKFPGLFIIALASKEYLPVVFNFQLPNTSINTIEKYNFAVSQSLTDNPDKQYGSVCHFLVSINENVKNGEIFCDEGCNEENKETGNTSVFEENIKFSPNPVSDMANVDFTLKTEAKITAKVVDYYGRPIKTLMTNSKLVKGANKLRFSTSNLINGIYILTINAGSESRSLQFIVKH